MENIETPVTDSSIFDFHLDDETKSTFKTISIWAIICGVAGFATLVLTGWSMIRSLLILIRYSFNGYFTGYLVGMFVYIVVIFFLNYFVFQFGNKINKAINSESQSEFNSGLRHFKMYIRFFGILLIVIVASVIILFMIGSMLR